MKPALGPTFTYLADTTIWLTRAREAAFEVHEDFTAAEQDDDGETYFAEVLRSRNTVRIILTQEAHI